MDFIRSADVSDLQKKAMELFGKDTDQAKVWRLFLEEVPMGLPPVPGRYRRLAQELPGDWKVLRPYQLDPHDLAVTKLKRFHTTDREDLRILCDSGELSVARLEQAFDSAYPYPFDKIDDPACDHVPDNYRRVLDYLEGRSRDL